MTEETEKPTTPLPNKEGMNKIREKLEGIQAAPVVKQAENFGGTAVISPPTQFDSSLPLNQAAGQMSNGDGTLDGGQKETVEAYNKQFQWTREQEKSLLDAMRGSNNFEVLCDKVGRNKHAVKQKIHEMMAEKQLFSDARKVLLR